MLHAYMLIHAYSRKTVTTVLDISTNIVRVYLLIGAGMGSVESSHFSAYTYLRVGVEWESHSHLFLFYPSL